VAERRGNASEVWDWLMQGGVRRAGQLSVPEAASLFEDVEVSSEPYDVEETADKLITHLRTTSLFHQLDARQREGLEADLRHIVASHGGTVRTALAVVLMTARRSELRCN
jgi:hypothetical protein